MRVRHLGAGDLVGFRAMNALFCEVFGEPGQYASRPPDDEYVIGWLGQPSNIALLAEAEGQVVGALAGYELAKFEQARSEIYIYDLAVADSHRRQGVATALIDELRRIARERGAWTIFVQADIVPEDEPARALYRNLASEEITALHFDIAP
ncbi:N-acetyltransferase family protein [Parerythrobacter aurantius]|uniref:GNAT family N-acetyltransferase n=1 Tax=Parerythrobacter aurantius TaxID=3127706 RepID=UPI003F497A49